MAVFYFSSSSILFFIEFFSDLIYTDVAVIFLYLKLGAPGITIEFAGCSTFYFAVLLVVFEEALIRLLFFSKFLLWLEIGDKSNAGFFSEDLRDTKEECCCCIDLDAIGYIESFLSDTLALLAMPLDAALEGWIVIPLKRLTTLLLLGTASLN